MSTSHGGRYAPLDKKTLERLIQKLDALSQLRAVPQLQRSHPYLPDITREIKEHLRLILEKISQLSSNQYLQVTVHSLLCKTDECALMLKRHGVLSRRVLTKNSLVFSHILSELRALFPGGRNHGSAYQISKAEASTFWKQKFGISYLVEWKEFREALSCVHQVASGPLESALQSTMDLTCNDHISVFEFDVFTRLFQPWESLLHNWMLLAVTHPGYMAFLTYDEVKEVLQGHKHKPGSYIFRLSCTHLGQWAIGYVTTGGNILQTIPHNKSLYEALTEGEREGLYLYPNGLNVTHDLSPLTNSTQNTVIHVTKEQWEVYSDMDCTFELCKICADNQKNTKIQPCGHLICDQCLTSWQKSDNTCPFCRSKITGSQEILIDSQPEPEVQQTAMKSPQHTPDQSPHENAASNAWDSPNFESHVDEEEIDWIRSRPLPPPPPIPGPRGAYSTNQNASSAYSTSATRLIPGIGQQVLPTSFQRTKLQAQDIIRGLRPAVTRRT